MRHGNWPKAASIWRTRLALGYLASTLAACVGDSGLKTVPQPETVAPAAEPLATPRTAESLAAEERYKRIETNAMARGQLRTDGGGPDAPFTDRDLARNFLQIAFFDEFTNVGGRLVAQRSEIQLHRWQGAVRLAVEFGRSIPVEQRERDRADIAALVDRIAALTGLPIRMTDFRPNFTVLILNENERRASGSELMRLVPNLSAEARDSAVNMAPDTYCTVFAVSPANSAIYARAIAVLRGELPDILRLSCLHEEIAQGLGLVNDSPAARPSIFNDNDEFATLTRQDDLMLRILYDARLRPGMTLSEATPIVESIAAELMGGEVIAALP